MSKGTIVAHLGAGQYTVEVERQVGEIAAMLSDKQAEIDYIDANVIPPLDADMADLQGQIGAVEAELTAAILAQNTCIAANGLEGCQVHINLVREKVGERLRLNGNLAIRRGQSASVVADKLKISKEIARLQSAPAEKENITAWIADCMDAPAGEPLANDWAGHGTELEAGTVVSVADVYSDSASGGRYFVIWPDYTGQSDYNQQRDGMEMPSLNMSSEQLAHSGTLLAPVESWRPLYRAATITTMRGPTSADVALEGFHDTGLNGSGIDANAQTGATLSNVPIDYMASNIPPFEAGDQVLIWFENREMENPKIIGFITDPKPIPRANGWWVFNYNINATQGWHIYKNDSGTWVAEQTTQKAGEIIWADNDRGLVVTCAYKRAGSTNQWGDFNVTNNSYLNNTPYAGSLFVDGARYSPQSGFHLKAGAFHSNGSLIAWEESNEYANNNTTHRYRIVEWNGSGWTTIWSEDTGIGSANPRPYGECPYFSKSGETLYTETGYFSITESGQNLSVSYTPDSLVATNTISGTVTSADPRNASGGGYSETELRVTRADDTQDKAVVRVDTSVSVVDTGGDFGSDIDVQTTTNISLSGTPIDDTISFYRTQNGHVYGSTQHWVTQAQWTVDWNPFTGYHRKCNMWVDTGLEDYGTGYYGYGDLQTHSKAGVMDVLPVYRLWHVDVGAGAISADNTTDFNNAIRTARNIFDLDAIALWPHEEWHSGYLDTEPRINLINTPVAPDGAAMILRGPENSYFTHADINTLLADQIDGFTYDGYWGDWRVCVI